jgi:membrane dipeptidase
LKFHKNSIVADTHNDILSVLVQKGLDLGTDLSGRTHTDFSRLKEGGVDVQVFSVFCDERYGKGTAFNYAIREIDSLEQIANRNPNKITIVHTPKQLRQTIRSGKIAALTGVEGGHMIEDNLHYLDTFFNRGVRYMTLTWNNSTSWASSAADESQDKTPLGSKGLTAFGKQVVQRMNKMGMMIDVSHVGEQTFWDVINTTDEPIIASHSAVYNLCPHSRNLKDAQIKAIRKNGGVIFVNFYSGFIDSNYTRRKIQFLQKHKPESDSLTQLGWSRGDREDWLFIKYANEANEFRPTLDQLIDHFDYIIDLIGINHVGLGSDFDGIESTPKGIDGVQDLPKITQALLERGYTKKDVRKILGGNFIRVFGVVSSVKK